MQDAMQGQSNGDSGAASATPVKAQADAADGGNTPGSTRKAGRPVEFDREAVLTAAQRILEQHGADGLTMRRLAAEAPSTLAALYRHLGDRDGVLGATLDRYADAIERPELNGAPLERIRTVSIGIFDVLAELPWVVDVLRRGGFAGSGALWFGEEFMRALEELGASETQALEYYRIAWSYILGALLTRVEPERILEAGTPPADKLLAATTEQGLPRMARYIGAPMGSPDRLFRSGLDTLLAGMLTELNPASPS